MTSSLVKDSFVIALLFSVAGVVIDAVAASAPARVKIDSAQELNAAPRVWTPGTVLSHTDAQLGTEVAGIVTWISDVGALLKENDDVARINDQLFRIARDDSQAAVRGLEKRLVYLRSEANRLTSLASVNSAAQSQLDESVANRDVAIEALAQARAKQAMNQYRLGKTTVTAPFAGQIVERLVDRGEYVQVGQPIARLVDLHRVEVRSQAPLRVSPFVKKGMRLPIRHAGTTQEVEVSAVIPIGDLDSRTFEIRLKLQPEQWVIGTPVQVGLPTSSSKRILTVHRDALVLRESGMAVFVIDENIARRVAVKTGTGAEERIEIVNSELQAGDRVVISGAELLREGQEVSLTSE